jgi:hypothetical protein
MGSPSALALALGRARPSSYVGVALSRPPDELNPYAPPASAIPPRAAPDALARRIRAHGGATALIDPMSPLPLACLKCATMHEVKAVRRYLAVDGRPDTATRARSVSRASLVALPCALLPVWFFGATTRYLPTLVVLGLVMVGLASHYSTRLALNLPLCPRCLRRWQSGILLRGIALAGVMTGAALMPVGSLASAAVIVSSVVLLFATRVARRMVGGWFLANGTALLLLGLAPAAAETIAAKTPTPEV